MQKNEKNAQKEGKREKIKWRWTPPSHKRYSGKAPSPKYSISLSPLQHEDNEKNSLLIRW